VVIGDPPSEGAVNTTVAPFDPDAATLVMLGAPGIVAAEDDVDSVVAPLTVAALDSIKVPTPFVVMGATLNVYVPAASPVEVQVSLFDRPVFPSPHPPLAVLHEPPVCDWT
jgi:hypothetical protein